MYDASLHPREERPSLNLLDWASANRYLGAIRESVLDRLAEAALDGDNPLLKDGFVYNMIIQHEAQHNETDRDGAYLPGDQGASTTARLIRGE